jgi:hypothetical protein
MWWRSSCTACLYGARRWLPETGTNIGSSPHLHQLVGRAPRLYPLSTRMRSSTAYRSAHTPHRQSGCLPSHHSRYGTMEAPPTLNPQTLTRTLRVCLAGLRLLQKRLRLQLLWWSGFSDGAGVVLENVWQNGFTS